MTDTQTDNTTAADVAPNPDNVVTLTDLQNVLVVIDLASNRGAFRGPELQPVGALYDKINRFVQAALPKAPEGDGVESSTTVTDGSEVAA